MKSLSPPFRVPRLPMSAGALWLFAPATLVLGAILSLVLTVAITQASGPPDLGSGFNLPIRLEQGRSVPVKAPPGPQQQQQVPTPDSTPPPTVGPTAVANDQTNGTPAPTPPPTAQQPLTEGTAGESSDAPEQPAESTPGPAPETASKAEAELPDAPSGLQVSIQPDSLTVALDWDDVAGATGYLVRWRLAGPDQELNEGLEVQASQADITVADRSDWVVRVEACNQTGCGEGAAQQFGFAPATRTGLAVTSQSGSLAMNITWDAIPGSTSYKLRWRKPGGNFEAGNEATATTTNADITVGNYGKWVVRVEGCNDAGCGPGAAETVRLVLFKPGRPVPIFIMTPGKTLVRVDLAAVDGADSYKVRWRSPDGGFESDNEVTSAETRIAFSVSDYGKWVVRVEACNDAGCGPGAAHTLNVISPLTPYDLSVKRGLAPLHFNATWQGPVDATSYKLRWRKAGTGFLPEDETTVTDTNASFTVSEAGQWMLRLEGCNDDGCGLPAVQSFTADPPPETEPESTPQSSGRGYRGELGEVLVELSLMRPTPTAGGQKRDGGSGQSSHTTSIVYVIDDSGSMDGDYPEVRTALTDVRATAMADTKVALIAFGTSAETIFGLTDHSTDQTTGPWTDARIKDFGGKRGGTYYRPPLVSAKALLDADTVATTKKIIFLTDAQASRPTATVQEIDDADIIVDTIGFGDQYSDNFDVIEAIATDTGGVYKAVAKPLTGTTNTPAVTATAMSDILKDKVADNTATLFLVDYSLSVYEGNEDILHPALTAAATKAGDSGGTGRQVGLATFLGETTLFADPPMLYRADHFRKYHVINSVGSSSLSMDDGTFYSTGSTDIDHALQQAYSAITDSTVTATSKRVVLITDGISAAEVQQSPTLDNFKNNSSVTLDVVAWGGHADRVQLKSWANSASGNFNVAKAGPAAPKGFSATAGPATLELKWTDPNDSAITKYQYRHWLWYDADDAQNTSKMSDWMDIPGTGADSTFHIFTGVENLYVYYRLQIRAARGDDLPGPPSIALAGVRPDAEYSIGLTATAGDGQIELGWTDPSDTAITKYQYAQREGDGAWSAWTDISGSSATTISHTITSLTNGTAYTIALRWVKGTGTAETFGRVSAATATPTM